MSAPAARSDEAEIALVMTTFAEAAIAERVVHTLLDERLIACGNLVPDVMSMFRWEGEVAQEDEVIVLLKTATSEVNRLFERLVELHPYALPELVSVPVASVYRPYGQWVIDSTGVSA